MNTAILKTPGLWVGIVVAVLGVLLSQHVVLAGSTAASVIGWISTFLGSLTAGHQIASASTATP